MQALDVSCAMIKNRHCGAFQCVYGVKQRKAERDSARFKQLSDVDYNSPMASGAGSFELVRFSGKRDEKKAKNTASSAVFQRLAASIAHAAPGKRAKLIRALWKRRMKSLADRYENLKTKKGGSLLISSRYISC